jgi:hypothetical protein
VHHTAGPNSYATVEDAKRQLRSDYAYHTQTLGYCDLAYNAVVDKWGNLYEGRGGGMSRPVMGAHTGGFNTYTFGISILGDFSNVPVPDAVQRAIGEAVGWKLSLHGRSPRGTTSLTSAGGGTTRYAAGTVVELPTVFAHRNTGQTACPGDFGYATLSRLRSEAALRMDISSYLRALYGDMMGRAADEGGLKHWTSAFVYGAVDRRALWNRFSTSEEYRLKSVDSVYRDVFGRGPDPEGVRTWMNGLRTGAVRIDQMRPAFLTSREIYLRGGGTDGGYVNLLYRVSFGRDAARSERAFWVPLIAQYGQAAVVGAIWGSQEAGMQRVDATYREYLGRPAGAAEQLYWVPLVRASGDERMREEIMISEEYLVRTYRRFP